MLPELPDNTVLEFCHFARASGLCIGLTETLTALNAVHAIGLQSRFILKCALRAVLCSSQSEWGTFDQLFNDFWDSRERRPAGRRKAQRSTSSQELQQRTEQHAVMLVPSHEESATTEREGGKTILGATAHERLKRTDFSEIRSADLADLERIAMRLLQQMSLRLSRRLKNSVLRGSVDLRRTIRRNVSSGGDPMELSFRDRRLQQLRVVILLDISGSMNPYSLFLVRFAYAMQKYFRQVDTFLFSTHLTDITRALRTRNLQDALQAVAGEGTGWSGGTKIGDSLRELRMHHRGLLTPNTLFLMLSDGWETGSAAGLAAELAAIKQSVRKVLWLNPLLGMEGYEPVTQGMNAVLPFIDVFAPAHNLESLLTLEQHLRRA